MSTPHDAGSRLTAAQVQDIFGFAMETTTEWMAGGRITRNSWGLVMAVTRLPNIWDWEHVSLDVYEHGDSLLGAAYNENGKAHDEAWYIENAHGKKEVCLGAQMDSMEAVLLYPGIVRHLERTYPWGGGVFDGKYGIIIAVSGFAELEDILVARTIRNYAVMKMDVGGNKVIADAHRRGEQQGDAAADRFTRRASGIPVPT